MFSAVLSSTRYLQAPKAGHGEATRRVIGGPSTSQSRDPRNLSSGCSRFRGLPVRRDLYQFPSLNAYSLRIRSSFESESAAGLNSIRSIRYCPSATGNLYTNSARSSRVPRRPARANYLPRGQVRTRAYAFPAACADEALFSNPLPIVRSLCSAPCSSASDC